MTSVDYTFNTDVSPGQEISFNTSAEAPQLPDEVAKDRAQRAAWGLGNKLPYDDIFNGIKNGEESNVRHRAAIEVDKEQISDLSNVLNTYGVGDPRLLYQQFRRQPTGSVFEDQYAKEFMSRFFNDVTDDDSTFNQIAKEDPEGVAQNMAIGREQIAWNELVKARKLDAEAAYEAQSKLGKVGDFAKGLIPGYSTLKVRQVAGGFPTFAGFQKEKELAEYNSMPYPLRVAKFNNTMDKLIEDNPSMAIDYVSFIDNPTTKQQLLDNIFSILDLTNVAQAASLGAGSTRLIKSRRELARMVEEATKASTGPGSFESVAAHASGDNVTAGITKVSAEFASQLKGTLELDAASVKKDVQSVFKGDADALTAGGVGNLGAEPANRLRNYMMENLDKVWNALSNTNRVLRLGDALQNREVLTKAYDLIKNNFPGTDNNVLNIMPIMHRIQTNEYSADVIFGRLDGQFFGSPREALRWAAENGIGEAVRKGDFVKRVKGISIGSVEGLQNPVEQSANREYAAQLLEYANKLYEGKKAPTTFKTAQGSVYTVNKDLTTTRNASTVRPQGSRSAKGPQPSSEKTFYATEEAQNRLAKPQGKWRLIEHPDGTYSLATFNEVKGKWGVSPSARNIQVSDRPAVGLYPVEVWGKGITQRHVSYDKIHYGNKIIEVNEAAGVSDEHYKEVLKDVAKYTELANRGVYSQGRGYYIAYNVPLREPEEFIREAVVKTTKATNKNDGFLNRWYGGIVRGAGEVLSEAEQESRKLSSYAPAIFKQMVVEAAGNRVGLAKANLRGKNWYEVAKNFGKGSEFERAINSLQADQKDLKSIAEIEDFWLSKFNHRPDEVQMAGYFAIKQAEAMNYVFTNMSLYRNMRRLGGEQHVFTKTLADGTVMKSPSVVGMIQKEIPDDNGYVAIQVGDNKWKVIKAKNHLATNDGKLDAEAVKNGSKRYVKLYNPDLKQFQEFVGDDKYIRYILSDRVETSPLNLFQIPRREAGHLEYQYDHYVKTANMHVNTDTDGFKTYHYSSDKTAMAVESRAAGQQLSDALNKVRIALRDGDVNAAKLAARAIDLPWSYVSSKFIGRNKVFDLNEPFYTVPKGKTIKDIPNHFDSLNVKGQSEFIDTSKGVSPARQFQVEFTGERDAYDVMAMHKEGTSWNPVYNYKKADLIDPWTSINRANTRMVNSLFMDDVKIQSVESWIQRYKDHLAASPEEFRDNPYRVFATDQLRAATPDNLKAKANAERYAIKAFAGIPSKLDNAIRAVEEGLTDSIYNATNPFSRKASQLSRWTFKTAVAAPDFIKFATTHMAIGVFSPVQFAVQNMTYVTIWGLAGSKLAGQGTAAALMHQWSRLPFINDGVLEALGRKMEALGWRPGEWLEARKELSRTGFEYVSKETNLTLSPGHIYPTRIAQTAFGNFLDMGEMFFKGGERNVRYGAWYTAFKEWRNLNPTRNITLADRNAILARADLLAGEMTKANKSMLQSGPLAWSSQFLGYNLRLMELFTGKRLDWKTKARLLAVYAGAFGIPVTTGVATVIPASDWLKRKAIEYGYVEGENPIVDTFLHGMPAALSKMVTGEGYNVGERYGPSNVFAEALQGDKSFWRVMTGAPGTMLFDAWMKTDPYVRVMAGALSGQENPFKITTDDMVAPLKDIASVNAGVRLQQALATGDWLSKNETTMAQGVNPWQATFMTATGLSPTSTVNNQIFKNAGDVQKQLDEQTEKNFVRDYVRGLRLLKNSPDPQGANVYFKNALAELERKHYPLQKRAQLISRAETALKGTLPAREMFNYYVGQDVPSNEVQQRALTLGRQIQQGNYK